MSTTNSFVVETTRETFERDVIERSREVPIVVDFWAEWCGPCRILGPILERLAEEYEGKFVLVKANTEQIPELAGAFGVRSIPAVFGLRDGKVRDSFVGALPESAIRAFLERLLPTPAERATSEAQALTSTDPAAAEARYRDALALAPKESKAAIGLARLLLGRGRGDEARAIVEGLERRGFLEPEAETLKAELTLRSQGEATGGVESARAAAAANPSDLEPRLALAKALAASGDYGEALEILLDLVERDRKGVGEEARKTMVSIFRLLGEDELVGEYQRKLAAALF